MIDVMTHSSPDGRPPHLAAERKSSTVLVIGGAVFLVALGLLAIIGGRNAMGMALIYLPIMAVAAFPVWLSAVYRKREERHAVTVGRRVVRAWDARDLREQESVDGR